MYRLSIKPSATKELVVSRDSTHSQRNRRAGRDAATIRMQEIEGGDREWRVRVGDYRIIYTIDDENMHVDITKVGHRSSIYD